MPNSIKRNNPIDRRALAYYGAATYESSNGVEALTFYQKNPGQIDVVLTDHRMPKGDGLTLAKTLSSSDALVYICTGFGQISAKDVSESNTRSIIEKPFDLDQIVKLIAGDIKTRTQNKSA